MLVCQTSFNTVSVISFRRLCDNHDLAFFMMYFLLLSLNKYLYIYNIIIYISVLYLVLLGLKHLVCINCTVPVRNFKHRSL